MKKLFSFILILALCYLDTFAQPYARLGGGYGLGLATQPITYDYTSGSYDYVYGSFGEGFYINGALGYGINSSLAVELAANFLFGRTFESTAQDTSTTIVGKSEQRGSYFGLMPGVIITASGKKFQPYARFGGIVGFPGTTLEVTFTGSGAPSGTYIAKESGNIALGLQGALGVAVQLTKNLVLNPEIFGIAMNWGPDELENTETFNGFVLDPTIKYEESFSSSQQNVAAQPRRPFSSFGLNVAVSYYFGKRK